MKSAFNQPKTVELYGCLSFNANKAKVNPNLSPAHAAKSEPSLTVALALRSLSPDHGAPAVMGTTGAANGGWVFRNHGIDAYAVFL